MEQSRVYGYVNGTACFTRDEHIYRCRGFGEIYSDRVLMEYAEKITGKWQEGGWKRGFENFFLSDYCMAQPRKSLTDAEFKRLKELQKQAREAVKAADEARQWRFVRIECFADNSEEEVWADKDGNTKRVMKAYPHGDGC